MAEILSKESFRIAVLHAAKHPESNICGALTGSGTIEAAMPLFHSPPTTPTLEVALSLITDSFQLVGFYESRFLPAGVQLSPSPFM